MRIKKLILAFLAVSIFPFYPLSFAETVAGQSYIHSKATSTVPVSDSRIAQIWEPDSNHSSSHIPTCTASYIGEKFWITALHCVNSELRAGGYLKSRDLGEANILGVYSKSPQEDVALLKVDIESDADPFELPERALKNGESATLSGYGIANGFLSTAPVRVQSTLDRKKIGDVEYKDMIESTSETASRSCSGDSGAPVYKGSTIYAVHSAGGFNPSCLSGHGKKMWHSSLESRISWIRSTTGVA